MRLQYVLAGLLLVAAAGFVGGVALGSVVMHLDGLPTAEGAQKIPIFAAQGLTVFEGSHQLLAGLLMMLPVGLLYRGLRVRRAVLAR